MGAHADQRINHTGSILNFDPFIRVRVIRGPRLWSIIHHPRIKAFTAARAGFKQNGREPLREPLIQPVNAQHVAVHEFSLPFRGKLLSEWLTHVTVEIPLDIGYPRTGNDPADHFVNCVHHFLPGEIQNILMSSRAVKPAGLPDDIIRMLPEEPAVFIDHLEFDPETKLKAHRLDFF